MECIIPEGGIYHPTMVEYITPEGGTFHPQGWITPPLKVTSRGAGELSAPYRPNIPTHEYNIYINICIHTLVYIYTCKKHIAHMGQDPGPGR